MGIDRFETTRLVAERLTSDHRPEILRMHSDPIVMATLGGVRDGLATQAYLEQNLAHWDGHGFGMWILREKITGAVVGRAALRHLLIEETDEVELGYALFSAYWGLGLATEIAQACVQKGRDILQLSSIVAVSTPGHVVSQRVMVKAGFSFDRLVNHSGTPHVLYRVATPAPSRTEPAER